MNMSFLTEEKDGTLHFLCNTNTVIKISKEDLHLLESKNWYINKIGKTKYLVAASWNKRTKKQGTYYFHRIIMKPRAKFVVDHISGNGLDNARKNLRIISHKNNIRHRIHINKNNKLGVIGVHLNGRLKFKKYTAKIKVDYKDIHLGNFVTLKEAKDAYEKGKVKYHGQY